MRAANLQKIYSDYYQPKLDVYGASPKGVDWNSAEAQKMSFEQLIQLIPASQYDDQQISLLDFGCGYGALHDYIRKQKIKLKYTGYDILPSMLAVAQKAHQSGDAKWIQELPENAMYDYVIACGVCSLKLQISEQEWEKHILRMLTLMNKVSKNGFAFNSLTSYSDKHLMKDHLYYPDPGFLFDYCKKKFSNYVSLIHDYPKYEFTIIVRKKPQ